MNNEISRRSFIQRSSVVLATMVSSGLGQVGVQSQTELQLFNVTQFGAKGDGQTKDTAAIQGAINAAGRKGGCVYFPPGRYVSGTVRLRSHVTIQFENGATLVAAPERSDFDEYEKLLYSSFSDEETTDFNFALIRGREIEHVAIIGPGRIDMARTRRGGPKPIALKLCRNILVRDLTIENSPNYNISLLGCDFVDVMGVTIVNGYCDGIDPDCCRHVRISNCFIESWDDAIVPKASPSLGYLRATEHVTVTNCVLTTGCNALKLGTESSGGFKDIAFSNCTVFSSPNRWPGRRANSGVSLEMVDGGALERVAVSNITIRGVRAPLFVRLGNRGRAQAKPTPQHLSDISISDIVATDSAFAGSIMGIPGHPITGIALRNIRLMARGGGKAELASRGVPEQEDGYPDAGRFGDLPAYGLYCRHVDGLTLDGLSLGYAEPDGRPAMVLDDVSNADVRMIVARPPEGEQPAVRFHNVRNCFVQGCRAVTGTQTWAVLSGTKTAKVHEAANDFSEATVGIQSGADVPSGVLKSSRR